MLIATLEMLQAKTKGNLSAKESELIDKSVNQLHDIFEHTIAAIEKAQAAKEGRTVGGGICTPPEGIITPDGQAAGVNLPTMDAAQPEEKIEKPIAPMEPPPPSKEDEESKKRFSKKY